MDAVLCVEGRELFIRRATTERIRQNGWREIVIRKRRWELGYARLVVEAVLGGIVPADVHERVQDKVSFRDAIGNLEMLSNIIDELTPAQAVCEGEQATLK